MSKYDSAMVGDEELYDPRLLALPRAIRLLHIEALAWCNKHRTDGVMSPGALRFITDQPRPAAAVARLVAAKVWKSADGQPGWQLPWESQIEAEEVEAREAKDRAKWKRQKKHQRGDHSECNPKYCPQADKANVRDPVRPPTSRIVSSRSERSLRSRRDETEKRLRRSQDADAPAQAAPLDEGEAEGQEPAQPKQPRRPKVWRLNGATGPATVEELDEALEPFRSREQDARVHPALADKVAALIPEFGGFNVATALRRATFEKLDPVDWLAAADRAETDLRSRKAKASA